jgi:hypothetical protein
MALPRPAQEYGLPVGGLAAVPGSGQVLYRILRDRQPSKDDFRSDEAAGRPRGPSEPWIEHTGISTFDDLVVATALLGRFPVFVAELALPEARACSVAKTGQPHHYTVWGDRKILLASVRTVYLQRYAKAPIEPR